MTSHPNRAAVEQEDLIEPSARTEQEHKKWADDAADEAAASSAPEKPAIVALDERLRQLADKAKAAYTDTLGKKGEDYAAAMRRYQGLAGVRDRVEAQFKAAGGAKALKSALDAARRATESEAESDDWHYLGRVFAREFAGQVALVEGSWGSWCGTHWNFEDPAHAYDLASGFLSVRGTEKVRTTKGAPRELLDRAAHGLTRKRDDFDAPRVAHLMSVANGTVNLRTGELLPHEPTDLITAHCPVAYRPDADQSLWRGTLLRSFGFDGQETAAELSDYFQRAVGYTATGETNAKKAFFAVGNEEDGASNGDNGKSLVMNQLSDVLGGYYVPVSPAMIRKADHKRGASDHNSAVLELHGRRAAFGAEFDRSDVMDEAAFKVLTGGDGMGVRGAYHRRTTNFTNRAKLWFTTNYVPMILSQDAAMETRLAPIPFFVRFYRADDENRPKGAPLRDETLRERLRAPAAMEGVLAWIVEGARAYYATDSLPEPLVVSELRQKIIRSFDRFADFFEEAFVKDPNGKIAVSDIMRAYGQHDNDGTYAGKIDEKVKNMLLRSMRSKGLVPGPKIAGEAFRYGFSLSARGAAMVSTMASKHTTVFLRAAPAN